MGAWLAAIGVVFQVVGVAMAGLGARRTWQEFGTEPFWEFIAAPSHRAWQWVKSRLRRRPVTVHGVGATIAAKASVTGRGRVGFRIIPRDLSVEDSIAELDQRTRRVLDQLQDATDRLDDEITRLRDGLDSLREEARGQVEELRDSDRRVATSGIRLEAVGLLFVALGVMIQAVGSAIG